MLRRLRFNTDETGQGLIEYTLLLGFLVLGAVSVFLSTGESVNAIWQVGGSRLVSADSISSGGSATPAASPRPPSTPRDHDDD